MKFHTSLKGGVKFAGPKEAPKDICTDRIIGTGEG